LVFAGQEGGVQWGCVAYATQLHLLSILAFPLSFFSTSHFSSGLRLQESKHVCCCISQSNKSPQCISVGTINESCCGWFNKHEKANTPLACAAPSRCASCPQTWSILEAVATQHPLERQMPARQPSTARCGLNLGITSCQHFDYAHLTSATNITPGVDAGN